MEVGIKHAEKVVDFLEDLVEVVVPVLYWIDFSLNLVDPLGVGPSGRVLSVTVEPFAVLFKEFDDGWNVFGLGILLVSCVEEFLPLV